MSVVDIMQRGGEFVVSSEAVAYGSGVQHKNVLELIDANRGDFEEFGQVAFETRPGYNNAQARVALLNEQQATLLMTYQRNTEQVRVFKKALVRAFFEVAQRTAVPVEVSRRDLALAVLAAEDEADRQRARAEVAETFKPRTSTRRGFIVTVVTRQVSSSVHERSGAMGERSIHMDAAYRFDSSPGRGPSTAQVAVDEVGNFAVYTKGDPRALALILRGIADEIEADVEVGGRDA